MVVVPSWAVTKTLITLAPTNKEILDEATPDATITLFILTTAVESTTLAVTVVEVTELATEAE